MQPIESTDGSVLPSVVPTKVILRLHEVSRYAEFSPSQHLLRVSEGGVITGQELSYSSSRLLELLICHADLIVGREEMFAYGWPGRVVGQNSLNQAISNIRDLLGDDVQRTIIQTIPRRGYRFNSAYLSEDREEFNVSDDTAPAPPVAADAAEGINQPEQGQAFFALERLPRSTNLLLGVLTIALAATLVWRIDWALWLQHGLFSASEALGELDIQYVSESPEELTQLQADIKPLRDRLQAFVKQPETIIFNKMHGFYEIVCIDQGRSVQFLTVHKTKLSQLTDEQLNRCVN